MSVPLEKIRIPNDQFSSDTPLFMDASDLKGPSAIRAFPGLVESAFSGDPQAQLVIVSGSGPNVFGHMLLCFDTIKGFYVHVHRAGKHKPNVICGADAFQYYLKKENKTVLDIIEINDMTDKNAAREKLKKRLMNKYFWGAATHNCAEFAATIVQAGGSKYTAKCWLPSEMKKEMTNEDGYRKLL
jgi:hypothetical protein